MRHSWLLILSFSLGLVSSVQAGQPTYLNIHTADGKDLRVLVKSFRGLSSGVIATLVKEGKMVAPAEKSNLGMMVFYLDKSMSADVSAWASTDFKQLADRVTETTGQFQCIDPKSKTTENFIMTGIKVTEFRMGTPKEDLGAYLAITADKTVADPPIDFSGK
jgi:hypothetical protein